MKAEMRKFFFCPSNLPHLAVPTDNWKYGTREYNIV